MTTVTGGRVNVKISVLSKYLLAHYLRGQPQSLEVHVVNIYIG